MPTMITIETEMPSDRPVMSVITTSTTNTNTMMSESDRMPTVQTTGANTYNPGNDMTISTMNAMGTNPTMSDKPNNDGTSTAENQMTQNNPTTTFSSGSTSPANIYTNPLDSTKMPNPPTMMTSMDRFPSTATTYGSTTNTDLSTNEVKPQTYHPSIYMGGSGGDGSSSSKPDDFNYPYPPHFHNKYNYYHDIYPFYTYPTFIESTYPSVYMAGTGGYAPNAPTTTYQSDFDYYGTTPSMNNYGAGNGNGNGASNGQGANNRPTSGTTYMGNGWSNADDSGHRKQNGANGNGGSGSGGRYPDRDSNSGSYPEGKYNGTTMVPYIRTYFNPDFYLMDAKSEYKLTFESDVVAFSDVDHHLSATYTVASFEQHVVSLSSSFSYALNSYICSTMSTNHL